MDNILDSALGDDASKLAAAEKQMLLSRLLARLAHEIRNPLSSLDIHVQLLDEDLTLQAPAVREKLSNRLEIIHGEIHRLENIVQQFLRLARPSTLELEPTNIERLVQHVADLLGPELGKHNIQITTQAQNVPPLLADASQLTQALLNLAINAVQAIENGGRVELKASQAGNFIQVSVSDSGPGIPADKMGSIFEPYFTTKPDGTGLGLWIAQQIALAHGGNVYAANAPDGGAVFTLKLPIKGKNDGQRKD